MAVFMLRGVAEAHKKALEHGGAHHEGIKSRNPFVRFQQGFERGFARLRHGYRAVLADILGVRYVFVGAFLAFTVASVAALGPWLGQIFFPGVDAGSMYLHIMAQTGTRIEETARLTQEVEDYIRTVIPKDELQSFIDNIDLPVNGIPDAGRPDRGRCHQFDADLALFQHAGQPKLLSRLQNRHHLFPGRPDAAISHQ
jgi:multidrug efflux pump subunit AcrB